MPKKKLLTFVCCMSLAATGQQSTPGGGSLGFTPQDFATEQSWETRFRAIPDAKRVHANMQHLAAHPHNVGSEYQRQNAEWLVARYKEWGWDAHIERFRRALSNP